jgi:hypothetical protein
MPALNLKRILFGGLLAGLVVNFTETFFNLVLVGKAMEAAFKHMNLPPFGPWAMAFYTLWGFIQGLLSVWLYASLRSQYGPGPRTAVRAGLLVWALAYAFPNLGFGMMGMAPWSMVGLTLAWSLIEAPLVTLLGARIYRD